MRVMIINGSLGGRTGNTSRLIDRFSQRLRLFEPTVEIDHRILLTDPSVTASELQSQDAFVFTTGTYWDSWGSPLQTFFEHKTPLEADLCWFGKPAAAIVTMHSVGGKEVLSRLQGVLNSFGLFVPPMSAMTYSLANQLALESESTGTDDDRRDLWCLEDLDVIVKNLVRAVHQQDASGEKFSSWPVDRADPKRIWLRDVSS